ncbi:MAG: hypothetical protein AB7S36_23550 [Planctomycetota bacterium]
MTHQQPVTRLRGRSDLDVRDFAPAAMPKPHTASGHAALWIVLALFAFGLFALFVAAMVPPAAYESLFLTLLVFACVSIGTVTVVRAYKREKVPCLRHPMDNIGNGTTTRRLSTVDIVMDLRPRDPAVRWALLAASWILWLVAWGAPAVTIYLAQQAYAIHLAMGYPYYGVAWGFRFFITVLVWIALRPVSRVLEDAANTRVRYTKEAQPGGRPEYTGGPNDFRARPVLMERDEREVPR